MAMTYQVRSGDTLRTIAEFHRAAVDDLLSLNPEVGDPDTIFAGQILNVPDTPEDGPSIHAAMASGRGPVWFDIAMREMNTGVDEIPGLESNPRIIEYHQTTSLKATNDEVAWCSSFLNWCLLKAGYEPTRSAAARSWLGWGAELGAPRRGCIVVLSRPPKPASGHVGFFDRADGGRVFILGGNQSDQVNIRSYPEHRVLSYRWPD